MSRLKHILAATDLSPESLSAVRYAAHIAKAEGARLTVVHAAQTVAMTFAHTTPPSDMLGFDRDIETAASAALERFAKTALRGIEGLRLVVRSGEPDEVVARLASDRHASLVVISATGSGKQRHRRLAPTTKKIMDAAPCPVLVVPCAVGEPAKLTRKPSAGVEPRKRARKAGTRA